MSGSLAYLGTAPRRGISCLSSQAHDHAQRVRDQADTSACRTPSGEGYVYFMQATHGGPVKIGWAVDPAARLAELQTGHPDTLVIRRLVKGDRKLEAQLHRHYASARLRGEWFALDGYEHRTPFTAATLKQLALRDHFKREGVEFAPHDPAFMHMQLREQPVYEGELPDYVEGEAWSML